MSLYSKHFAFSLIELLVVMAIAVAMMALLGPAIRSLGSANGFTQAAFEVKGLLDQARAYATANNTYVYVGFAEVDATVAAGVVPQVNTGPSACGRVAVAVVATKDGSTGYGDDVGNWVANYNTSTSGNLVAVGKISRIEGVHLVDIGSNPPGSGNMHRPAVSGSGTPNCNIGNSACVASTPFAWPLNGPVPASSTAAVGAPAQYAFFKVIQFDPQGSARIPSQGSASNALVHYIEAAFQSTHGNIVPVAPTNQNQGNQFAIQIDSITGATRLFRP